MGPVSVAMSLVALDDRPIDGAADPRTFILRWRAKLATTSAKRRVRDLAGNVATSNGTEPTDALKEERTGTETTA